MLASVFCADRTPRSAGEKTPLCLGLSLFMAGEVAQKIETACNSDMLELIPSCKRQR